MKRGECKDASNDVSLFSIYVRLLADVQLAQLHTDALSIINNSLGEIAFNSGETEFHWQ